MREVAEGGSTWGVHHDWHVLVGSSKQPGGHRGRGMGERRAVEPYGGVPSSGAHNLGQPSSAQRKECSINTQVLTEKQGKVRTAGCSAEGSQHSSSTWQAFKIVTTEANVYQVPSAPQAHWVGVVISPILQMRKLRLQGVKAPAQGHELTSGRARASEGPDAPSFLPLTWNACTASAPHNPNSKRTSPWLHQLQLSLHRSFPYTLCLPVPSALALRQAQNSAAAGSTAALCPLFPQENLKSFQERGPGSMLSGQGQRDQSNWLNCLA